MKVLFLDFEVFRYDWLVVIADLHTKEYIEIVNDVPRLEAFYTSHRDYVWVGYNIKGYDQYILKGLLQGYSAWDISNWIVALGLDGWRFSRDINFVPLNIYDVQFERSKSLKWYEASMGHSIVESGVDFDLDRKLTEDEITTTLKYCRNDVNEGVRVFMLTKDDFTAHCQLLSMFHIPLKDIRKTKVQLSAQILGATDRDFDVAKRKADEFDIDLPPTLVLNKYRKAADWYMDWSNRSYGKSFDMLVAGCNCQFGWGGLHGALEKYDAGGRFLIFDVASLYPSLMVEYDLLSRYARPEHYRQIRDMRLKYKAEGNPLEAPLKIVLNGSYGASKDRNNPMYDPRQANRVCVYGQLLLLDLIEKMEGLGLIYNINTDGVMIKLNSEEVERRAIAVTEEWQKRTRLKLDTKVLDRVAQRDVNTYAMRQTNGKLKLKGAYCKKTTPLSNELAVIQKAVVSCLLDGVPVEKTIRGDKCLMDFQMIKRATGNHPTLILDGKDLDMKTIRVFASKDGGELYKRHRNGNIARVEGMPQSVAMLNEDITDMAPPDWLDLDWYIREAERRVESFRYRIK